MSLPLPQVWTGRSACPRRSPSWPWPGSRRTSRMARLRRHLRARRDRHHRPAGAGHDRRARLRQLDGEPLCGAAPAPGPHPGPLAARARHRRDAGRQHGPGLVPRTSRRGYAAWPAVSLVGSYELLVWIIRTAAAGDLDRGPAADHGGPQADHYGTSLRLAAAQGSDAGPVNLIRQDTGLRPGGADGPLPVPRMTGAGQANGPGRNTADHSDQMADQRSGSPGPVTAATPDGGINAAAVACGVPEPAQSI